MKKYKQMGYTKNIKTLLHKNNEEFSAPNKSVYGRIG
mgnify:CR=1 FL=1